tara:strand:+ start:1408 stop:1650 length:243 start_codon:yes stop_codon:yes gene_type:complete
MHTSYTVGVTTGQYKALQYVMVDQKEWIQNAIDARATAATKEITTRYTTYKVNKEEPITAIGSTAIITAAYNEGVIGIAT